MISKKQIGIALIVISIVLIVLFSIIKIEFDKHGIFLCEAVSQNPSLDMAQCPAHTSSIPTLVTIGIAFSILVFILGLVLVFLKDSKVTKPKKEFKEVNLISLSQEEKQIYSLLRENNGSMYQSDLVKQTGLGKVRITRILDKLEHDDQLIERKRRGMTNLVVLR